MQSGITIKPSVNNLKINEMKKVFIECECGSHILKVEKDTDDGEVSIYISMYTFGTGKHGWTRRLINCWNILRTGTPYRDQLVLTEAEFSKLKNL